jgi:hypothetical protein
VPHDDVAHGEVRRRAEGQVADDHPVRLTPEMERNARL